MKHENINFLLEYWPALCGSWSVWRPDDLLELFYRVFKRKATLDNILFRLSRYYGSVGGGTGCAVEFLQHHPVDQRGVKLHCSYVNCHITAVRKRHSDQHRDEDSAARLLLSWMEENDLEQHLISIYLSAVCYSYTRWTNSSPIFRTSSNMLNIINVLMFQANIG